MSSYATFPKATINWGSVPNMTYVIIYWTGNTVSTSTTYNSGNIYLPTTSFITGDLSYNTLYSFEITPYNNEETSGKPNTIYVDTTPLNTGIYASYESNSSVKIMWHGTYDYVKISRSMENQDYIDISSVVISSNNTYIDLDISGNTSYSYYITTYNGSYPNGVSVATSDIYTIKTGIQAPKDISINLVDTSGFVIDFTLPKNTYSTYAYYSLVATDISNNYYTVTSTKSPFALTGLSSGASYKYYIKVTLDYSNNLVGKTLIYSQLTESGYATIPSNMGFALLQNGDISFNYNYVDPSDNITYSYFFVKDSSGNASIKFYNIPSSGIQSYYLAVGGGSASGGETAGGGGGEVLQDQYTIQNEDKMVFNIGVGGICNNVNTSGTSTKIYIYKYRNFTYNKKTIPISDPSTSYLMLCSSGNVPGNTVNSRPSRTINTGYSGGAGAGGNGNSEFYIGSTLYCGAGGDGVQYKYYGFPRYWFGGGGGGGYPITSSSYISDASFIMPGPGGKGGGGAGCVSYYSASLEYTFVSGASGDNYSIYPSRNARDIFNPTNYIDNSFSFINFCSGAPNSGGGSGGIATGSCAYYKISNTGRKISMPVNNASLYVPEFHRGGSGAAMITLPRNTLPLVDDMSGLVFYYKMNNNDIINNTLFNTITNTYDASINNVSINNTTYVVGNGSVYCDNSSGYINLPDISGNARDYSIAFWFNCNSVSTGYNNMIFSLYNDVSGIDCYIEPNTNKFYIKTTKGNAYSPFTITTNTWYHVIWNINANGKTFFHLNGGLNNGGNSYSVMTGYINPDFKTNNSSIFSIYNNGVNGFNGFNGYIDDFRFYNKALYDTEKFTIYNKINKNTLINSITFNYEFINISITISCINTKYVILKNMMLNTYHGPYIITSSIMKIILPLQKYDFLLDKSVFTLFPFNADGMQGTGSIISIKKIFYFVDTVRGLSHYYRFNDISNGLIYNYSRKKYDTSLLNNKINNTLYIEGPPNNTSSLTANTKLTISYYNESSYIDFDTTVFTYDKQNSRILGETLCFWIYDISGTGKWVRFLNAQADTPKVISNDANTVTYQCSYSLGGTRAYSPSFTITKNKWTFISVHYMGDFIHWNWVNNVVLFIDNSFQFVLNQWYDTLTDTIGTNNGSGYLIDEIRHYRNNSFIKKAHEYTIDNESIFFQDPSGKKLNTEVINTIMNYRDTNISYIIDASAIAIDSSSIYLYWTGSSNCKYYLVYMHTRSGMIENRFPHIYGYNMDITNNSYTITGLTFSSIYKFNIVPYDSNLKQGIPSKKIIMNMPIDKTVINSNCICFISVATGFPQKEAINGYLYIFNDFTGNNNHITIRANGHVKTNDNWIILQCIGDPQELVRRDINTFYSDLSFNNFNFNQNSFTIIFWLFMPVNFMTNYSALSILSVGVFNWMYKGLTYNGTTYLHEFNIRNLTWNMMGIRKVGNTINFIHNDKIQNSISVNFNATLPDIGIRMLVPGGVAMSQVSIHSAAFFKTNLTDDEIYNYYNKTNHIMYNDDDYYYTQDNGNPGKNNLQQRLFD